MRGKRMYRCLFFLVLCGFFLTPLAFALELNFGGIETKAPVRDETQTLKEKGGVKVSINSRGYKTDISGDASRSFSDEKAHFENNLRVSYDHPSQDGEKIFHLSTDLRHTDDGNAFEKKAELLNVLLTLGQKGRYEFQAGDISVQGAKYTFQRSLEKGASYRHHFMVADGNLDVQTGYGLLQKKEEGVQFSRMLFVSGLTWGRRMNGLLCEQLNLHFGYAKTWDDKDSITQTETPDKNQVFGSELELRLKGGFSINSAIASSSFREGGDTLKDKAFFFGVKKNFTFGDLKVDCEKVNAGFRSLSGSGSPDTQRIAGYANTNILKRIDLSTGVNQQKDNLSQKEGPETISTSSDLFLSYRPFSYTGKSTMLQSLQLSLSADNCFHKSRDNSMKRNTLNQSYGISTVMYRWQPRIDYLNQQTDDKLDSDNDRQGNTWRLSLSHPDIIEKIFNACFDTREITGGILISWDRSDDRLITDPDSKNTHTAWCLNSSGDIFRFAYSFDLNSGDVDYGYGTNDYRKTGWKLSLSRNFGRLKNFGIGALVRGSRTRDEDPQKTFKEFGSQVFAQASF